MQLDTQYVKPIGILGGTFDPIHFGHLRCAIEIHQILNLQEIRLLPCHQPVHKNGVIANAHHRFAMVQLAIANVSSLYADDREIIRNTPSYMVDTLESLRKEFKERPLALILGTDAFLSLPTWHRWEQILELAHIVVAIRPGCEFIPDTELKTVIDNFQVSDFEKLHENKNGHIYLQTITQLEITATAIRQQIAAKYDPSYLIPAAVWEYIQIHGLYRTLT